MQDARRETGRSRCGCTCWRGLRAARQVKGLFMEHTKMSNNTACLGCQTVEQGRSHA